MPEPLPSTPPFRVLARLTLAAAILAMFPTHMRAQQEPLVTGKRISQPSPGEQQEVGSLPMNLVLSPDGRYAVSSDMGYRQSLWAIDAKTGRGVSHLDFKRNVSEGLYYGLAMEQRGSETRVYASQGAVSAILTARLSADGKLTKGESIELRPGDLAAGLALDRRGYLYVAINTFSVETNDIRVMTSPGRLAVIDTKTGVEVSRRNFGPKLSNFPFAVAALRDGSRVFVTSQRDGTVTVLDARDPAAIEELAVLKTGSHPVSLCLNSAETRLYVANAQSDTVSIIDTAANRITGTISMHSQGASRHSSLPGATPTGLALSPDEKSLYVSLGDMNAIAVVNLALGVVSGYIPTGWYPTAVAATRAGKLLWANGKGTRLRNPNGKPVGPDGVWGAYSLSVIEGTIATLPVPNPRELAVYTRQALANNAAAARAARALEVERVGRKAGKIKHVIYVIKENRTYDQVLGDLTDAGGKRVGNGDPSLALFGKAVTPNQHALALRFVTLDNFYDCGEVSGDGWVWSTQGMANEYVIKNVPYSYSGRGRKYDYEGQNNGYPVGGFPSAGPDGKPLVSPLSPLFPSAPPIEDVAESPGGHIWDSVLKAGLTVRNYGFFLTFGVNLGQAVMMPANYPAVRALQPPGHDLAGRTDYDFLRFDLTYPDSDAPRIYFDRRTRAGSANAADALYPTRAYGLHKAPSRFSEWNNEFKQMLAKDPTGGAVPNLTMIRFMQDHTQGVKVGGHTPDSYVADNDYAVGQLVEAVSASPIWESTAIFIIEDDAQDGQDHVDCHRSTCFVISPYIKANSVDHGFYNTDSVLRTIELLLGVPPMTQYDATATPILNWDTVPSNRDVYRAILPAEDIIAKKTVAKSPEAGLSKLSAKLDFVHPDSADPVVLNTILWKYARGLASKPPPPRHSPALAPTAHRSQSRAAKDKRRSARNDDDD